jgi:hypothetical protein
MWQRSVSVFSGILAYFFGGTYYVFFNVFLGWCQNISQLGERISRRKKNEKIKKEALKAITDCFNAPVVHEKINEHLRNEFRIQFRKCSVLIFISMTPILL